MRTLFFLATTVVALAGCSDQTCSPAEWYVQRATESQLSRAEETRRIVLEQGYSGRGARFEYCAVLCNPARTCRDPVPDGGTTEVSDSGSGGAGGMSSNGGEGGASVRVEKTYTVECYREQACGPSRSPTGFF